MARPGRYLHRKRPCFVSSLIRVIIRHTLPLHPMAAVWLRTLFPIRWAWLILLLGLASPALAQDSTVSGYLGGRYQVDVFSSALSPWHTISLDYQQNRRQLIWFGRVNLAQRFDTLNAQLELEAYRIRHNGDYWSVSGSYSVGPGFPLTHVAAEYFKPMNTWEVSLGGRVSHFAKAGTLWIANTSLSKYHGKFFSSLRPMVVYSGQTGRISAYGLRAFSRYYSSDYSYLQAALAGGYDPTLMLLTGPTLPFDGRINQYSGELTYHRSQAASQGLTIGYGLSLLQLSSLQRWQHTLSLAYKLPVHGGK